MEKFKIRTAYNDLTLYRRGSRIELRGRENSLQSVIDRDMPHRLQLGNLEHMLAALLFIPEPARVLMLGTAAGSLLHYLRHYLPKARITSVDIDAELVQRMQQLCLLPEASEHLAYVNADAAEYVTACEQQFDLVLVDIFVIARSPAWLLRATFTESLRRICAEGGAVAYNLLVSSDYDFHRFYGDLRRVYRGQALYLPVSGYENRIALAFRNPGEALNMESRMKRAERLGSRLGLDCLKLLSVIYNANPSGEGVLRA